MIRIHCCEHNRSARYSMMFYIICGASMFQVRNIYTIEKFMCMTDAHSITHSSDKALHRSCQSKRLNLLGQWKSQVTRGQTGLTQGCNVGVYSLYQAYVSWSLACRWPNSGEYHWRLWSMCLFLHIGCSCRVVRHCALGITLPWYEAVVSPIRMCAMSSTCRGQRSELFSIRTESASS